MTSYVSWAPLLEALKQNGSLHIGLSAPVAEERVPALLRHPVVIPPDQNSKLTHIQAVEVPYEAFKPAPREVVEFGVRSGQVRRENAVTYFEKNSIADAEGRLADLFACASFMTTICGWEAMAEDTIVFAQGIPVEEDFNGDFSVFCDRGEHANKMLAIKKNLEAAKVPKWASVELMQTVSVLIVAAKLTFWASNHHLGSKSTANKWFGYLWRVIEKIDSIRDLFPPTNAALRTVLHGLVHPPSTARVLSPIVQAQYALKSRGVLKWHCNTVRFMKPTGLGGIAFFPLSPSQDVILRFESSGAGTRRYTNLVDLVKRIASHGLLRFFPLAAELNTAFRFGLKIKNDPWRYGEAAPKFIDGGERVQWTDSVLHNNIAAYVHVMRDQLMSAPMYRPDSVELADPSWVRKLRACRLSRAKMSEADSYQIQEDAMLFSRGSVSANAALVELAEVLGNDAFTDKIKDDAKKDAIREIEHQVYRGQHPDKGLLENMLAFMPKKERASWIKDTIEKARAEAPVEVEPEDLSDEDEDITEEPTQGSVSGHEEMEVDPKTRKRKSQTSSSRSQKKQHRAED